MTWQSFAITNMKTTILLALSLIIYSANAQTQKGYYVTTTNDTVSCTFITPGTITGKIDLPALTRKITVKENNEKKKLTPDDINAFTINDRDGKTYTFVVLPADKSKFFQVVTKGSLSLYNLYSRHPYDGAASKLPIMVKNDKMVYLNVINRKQRIADLISDCPEVYKEWTEGNKYAKDIEAVVADYNLYMKEK